MKKYYFQLGFSCNNNCWHCSLPMWEHPHDLSTDEVKSILKKAKDDGVDVIALTGGEPTIRNDFLEIVKYAKSLNFDRIELQTNGRMLAYKQFAKKTVEYGVTDIYLSFHAPTKELQDLITRVKGSFVESLKGLRNILPLDVRVETNTVISKLNYKVLDKLMILFHEIGVKEVEIDFLRPIGNANKYFDLIVPKKSEVKPYLEKALEVAQNLGFDAIFVDDYPLCFMKKFKQYNADYIASLSNSIHDENAYNISVDSDLQPIQIHEEQKVKGPPCKNCIFSKYCEGDWKEYIQKFGWTEFKPIKENELD